MKYETPIVSIFGSAYLSIRGMEAKYSVAVESVNPTNPLGTDGSAYQSDE